MDFDYIKNEDTELKKTVDKIIIITGEYPDNNIIREISKLIIAYSNKERILNNTTLKIKNLLISGLEWLLYWFVPILYGLLAIALTLTLFRMLYLAFWM